MPIFVDERSAPEQVQCNQCEHSWVVPGNTSEPCPKQGCEGSGHGSNCWCDDCCRLDCGCVYWCQHDWGCPED